MSSGAIDLTGHRYGRLVVDRLGPPLPDGKRTWICTCRCGKTKAIARSALRSGRTRSCGCLRLDMTRIAMIKIRRHGDKWTPEHRAWCDMRKRCNTITHVQYMDYGGRGIKVCARWDVYEHFLADMGRRPSAKHSLDRIDNNGGYTPENCRWATHAVQSANRRPYVKNRPDARRQYRARIHAARASMVTASPTDMLSTM